VLGKCGRFSKYMDIEGKSKHEEVLRDGFKVISVDPVISGILRIEYEHPETGEHFYRDYHMPTALERNKEYYG
jgi:hypothetical protein